MKEYIIFWDAGYGKQYECVEVKSEEDAESYAYEQWREEVESNAEYGAMLATEELKEDYL